MKTIAQIFGIFALLSLFLIYQQKDRKKILFAKLSADIFWVMHYFLLGGFAGMIPNAVGIFRELVFIHRKDKRWANNLIWPILFVIVNLGLGITTFHSFYNVLPIAASVFVTVSLWIDNPRLTKLISVPVCMAFAVYDFYVASYIGIINESISILSITIFFIRERNKKHE